MKKLILNLCLVAMTMLVMLCGCGGNANYVLNEQTFFLVMTNMQYYPEQYEGCNIEYDCFTYKLCDVDGNEYICGVRKCSSGYGCTCGNDTIIGFLLEYDGQLPQPQNQSEDTNQKTWVHLKGQIKSSQKTTIKIYSTLPDGSLNKDSTESIIFLVFSVEECSLIDDYSNLNYYVTT